MKENTKPYDVDKVRPEQKANNEPKFRSSFHRHLSLTLVIATDPWHGGRAPDNPKAERKMYEEAWLESRKFGDKAGQAMIQKNLARLYRHTFPWRVSEDTRSESYHRDLTLLDPKQVKEPVQKPRADSNSFIDELKAMCAKMNVGIP